MTQVDDQRTIIPETILWRKDEEQAVLFDEERGEPYLLNDTATRVWELCQQGEKIGRIIEALLEEFEGDPSVIKKETHALLTNLQDKKLLRLEPDDS
jgi:hypothetical protein